MRKVVLSVAISLDGYIARPDGAVDFLTLDPAIDFNELFGNMDVAIMGRTTYEHSLRLGENPALASMTTYVFSRTLPPGSRDGVVYTSEPPSELIRRLRSQPGRDIWLMGGGVLAERFLREDLVDRLELALMPLLIGEGIPLFRTGFPERQFTLTDSRAYPSGIVFLKYDARRDAAAG